MTVGNRRLLVVAGSAIAVALIITGAGNWLLQFPRFQYFSNSIVLSWIILVIAFFVIYGTPIIAILVPWRWEPLPKTWKQITVRWMLGACSAWIGWGLSTLVLMVSDMVNHGSSGFDGYYFVAMMRDSSTYATIGIASLVIGVLDWTFFIRFWGKQKLTPASQ